MGDPTADPHSGESETYVRIELLRMMRLVLRYTLLLATAVAAPQLTTFEIDAEDPNPIEQREKEEARHCHGHQRRARTTTPPAERLLAARPAIQQARLHLAHAQRDLRCGAGLSLRT